MTAPMSGAGPTQWFFDTWSRIYDLPLVQRATYRPIHDAVLQALASSPVSRLLDIGCGTGQLAARVKRERPTLEVVGCDFSAGMLSRASARDRNVRWVQGDAERMPF